MPRDGDRAVLPSYAPRRRAPLRAAVRWSVLPLLAASWLVVLPVRAQPVTPSAADAGRPRAADAARPGPSSALQETPGAAAGPAARQAGALSPPSQTAAARAPAGAEAAPRVAAPPGTPRPLAAALPSARVCFDAAQADYFAGRLAEARRGFECAYAQLPSPELLWNLARVSERMGDVEQGARYFREYLRTAKLTARERQGVEKRIAALAALAERQQQASVLKPGPEREAALGAEARTFFERGAKLYRAGHYKAAAAAFTAALQLSDAPELHYNLAVAAERLGETADACDHYRAYLEASAEAPDREQVRAHIEALRSVP